MAISVFKVTLERPGISKAVFYFENSYELFMQELQTYVIRNNYFLTDILPLPEIEEPPVVKLEKPMSVRGINKRILPAGELVKIHHVAMALLEGEEDADQ